MKIMKKFIGTLLCAASVATLAFTASAAQNDSLKTDKTEYAYGEQIKVTAKGEGKDWVGLYLKDETPGATVSSIYWYYVAQDGNASGDEKAIQDSEYSNSERLDYFDIPAGEYRVYLCANDGYEVIAYSDITVKEPTTTQELLAPSSAVYTRSTDKAGYAEGSIAIGAPASGQAPDSYIVYWADDNGKLSGYASFAPVTASDNTVMTIPKNVIIPVGAKALLVYSAYKTKVSGDCVKVQLPDGAAVSSWGTPLYEFQVMSDVHLTDSASHTYNVHFKNALADIAKLSPDSIGIFINGDVTDHGKDSQYAQLKSIVKAAGDKIPTVYPAAGNHDLGFPDESYETYLNRFLTQTGVPTETSYYDVKIGNAHFIMLASEGSGGDAILSKTQLSWLREKLSEGDANTPVYILLHQPLYNTVAGSFPGQHWDGVADDEALIAVLKDFPQAILFSGHSHWELNSEGTMAVKTDSMPSIFSTGSCGYLWNDYCEAHNVVLEGSQGYYLYAYDGGVLVLGRDFANKLWLPSAQFIVEYEKMQTPEDTDTSASETETEAPAETQDTTAALTDKPAATEEETKATEPSGKNNWLIPVIIGAVVVVGAVAGIVISKKKK